MLPSVRMKGTSHVATSYDKAAAATHAHAAAAAAATAEVAEPYLAVPTEAGRYAFPGAGVGGNSVARHFKIL